MTTNLTELLFILVCSRSIGGLESDAIGGFNSLEAGSIAAGITSDLEIRTLAALNDAEEDTADNDK